MLTFYTFNTKTGKMGNLEDTYIMALDDADNDKVVGVHQFQSGERSFILLSRDEASTEHLNDVAQEFAKEYGLEVGEI